MRVSTFTSAWSKVPVNHIPVEGILKGIKTGKWKERIERLRKLKSKTDYNKFKKTLPGFTVTGTFDRRNDADFETHSGLVQIDIDAKDNKTVDSKGREFPMDYEYVWGLVTACPHVYAAFKSPSGKGIKALVKCPPDKVQHAGSYKAAADWLTEREVNVDTQVCALSQLCFCSYDPDLYINAKAKPVTPVHVDPKDYPLDEYDETRSQEEILRTCEEIHGQKFLDLWAGNSEKYTDDDSLADFFLISMLRDHCHSNEMVAEMFAESGLYREEKWNGRTRDYVFHTLGRTETVKAVSLLQVVPEDPADPAPKKKKKHPGWSWESARDIPDWVPENENYVIKNILYAGTSACIYGPPGSGKTFCVFSMAAAIAMGLEWQGHRVQQGAVMYFGLEGHQGVTKRIQAMKREGHLDDDANFARVNFHRQQMNLLEEDHVQKAKETIDAYEAECGMKVRLIIIDTLARATPGGDENSSKDMGVAAINAQAIADRTGCAVIIVHHSGKNASLGMRGSTALPAAFDSIYEVTRKEDDETLRVFKVKKQRDDTDSANMYFKLKIVELGVDNDGDKVTSCLVNFLGPDETPEAIEKKSILTAIGHDGATVAEIVDATGLAKKTVEEYLRQLGNQVEKNGTQWCIPGSDAPGFD